MIVSFSPRDMQPYYLLLAVHLPNFTPTESHVRTLHGHNLLYIQSLPKSLGKMLNNSQKYPLHNCTELGPPSFKGIFSMEIELDVE